MNRFFSAISAIALLAVLPTYVRANDATGPAAIDVSLVTPDDFAAIVIHPRRIAQSPLVAAQLKNETIAAAIKKFGIDPSDVEQIVMLMSMGELRPGRHETLPVITFRFTHDVDAKEVLTKAAAAMAGPNGPQPIKEVRTGDKTCFDLGPGDTALVCALSKNTLVLTRKGPKVAMEFMEKALSLTEPKGPLYERLKKADSDNDVIIALAPDAFPGLDKILDAARNGAPPLAVNYLDAAKTVKGGTLTVNLTAPSLLRMVLDAKDAEAADNVQELLDQALRMASGGLVVAKQSIPKEMQKTYGPVVKLADQIIDGAKATKSGSQVVLDVKRPKVLDTAGASIVGALNQSVIEARAAGHQTQQMNNMKQICLAMLNYEATFQSFPPAAIVKDGKPLLSWRVAILPFVEQDALYKQFHLDETWDSPHNLEVAKKMPSIFQSPDSPSEGKTRVMLFTGKGAAFGGGKKIRVADITDGSSMTILCVEAGPDKAVPWTKPEDLPFDPEKPLAALGKISPKGFIAAYFDGHVDKLKVDDKTLKALITPDGGEPIDQSQLHGGR
jgi:hypothetical protein